MSSNKNSGEVVVQEQHQHLSKWRVSSINGRPIFQTVLVGIVLFLNPGTYLAITGLGAGGKQPELIGIVNDANVVLYTLFGASAVVGGGVINKIGPRYSLMLGVTGYPVYCGSLWWIDKGEGEWFVLFGGAWLGLSAGILWAVQGYICTCYPIESEKGFYIATTWILNALGSVVGSAVVLGINISNTSSSGVPPAVYLTFICLECAGIFVAALLIDPSKIRRNDGRPIASFDAESWSRELKSLFLTLKEPRMTLITLAIYSCEMYLSLSGSFNSFYFNSRTRSLANFCYWTIQVVGSAAIAWTCDGNIFGRRRRRAFISAAFVAVIMGGTWIALLAFLASNDFDRAGPVIGIDWTDGRRFAGPFVLYMFLGASYPIFQNFLIWVYSTFSNEPRTLGRYSGYFKGVQAFGTATAFGIDSRYVSFLHQAIVYAGLMLGGLGLASVSVYTYTSDTTYGQEEGVVVPEAFDGRY
ncbi:putative membrane protein [Colletotrichum fructicola]|nr:putative membrane protein [Colletotrichum fructicola]KAF4908587.1 putative membrane protein [Colletotrichum fructicola]KAF4923222.1 putative membrane protein [Colletotrichum fructicola]